MKSSGVNLKDLLRKLANRLYLLVFYIIKNNNYMDKKIKGNLDIHVEFITINDEKRGECDGFSSCRL